MSKQDIMAERIGEQYEDALGHEPQMSVREEDGKWVFVAGYAPGTIHPLHSFDLTIPFDPNNGEVTSEDCTSIQDAIGSILDKITDYTDLE